MREVSSFMERSLLQMMVIENIPYPTLPVRSYSSYHYFKVFRKIVRSCRLDPIWSCNEILLHVARRNLTLFLFRHYLPSPLTLPPWPNLYFEFFRVSIALPSNGADRTISYGDSRI